MWGLLRVGLGCIYIMHLGVCLGLRSQKTKQKTAEKQNSGEEEKQRSRKAKKQRSRETEIKKKTKTEKKIIPKKIALLLVIVSLIILYIYISYPPYPSQSHFQENGII